LKESLKLIFPAKWESLQIAEDLFSTISKNITTDSRTAYHVRTVLSEGFSNAYLYGNSNLPEAIIIVEMCFNSKTFTANIINDGRGFADNNIKWNEFPSGDDESGRGLKIIKQLCDKLEYKRIGDNRFGIFVEIKLQKEEEKQKLI